MRYGIVVFFFKLGVHIVSS